MNYTPAVVVDKAVVTVSSCPDHPKYQATRYPISGCQHCLGIWGVVRGRMTASQPVHPDVLVAQRLEAAAQARRTGDTAMEALAKGLA